MDLGKTFWFYSCSTLQVVNKFPKPSHHGLKKFGIEVDMNKSMTQKLGVGGGNKERLIERILMNLFLGCCFS